MVDRIVYRGIKRDGFTQVTQHCVERGNLLDRIWRSLNDLFEFVLSEMARTVAR